ncbi:MAG: TerB family tellurite resistance protein [Rhodospirillales bacterium]|jgi:DnaJ like chaperone protein|nr:TerB family tellurite resistance protein [Rhodospirillales bacterium]
MSIWGKVLGGVAGFALGGPLGALMGAVAGHMMVDKNRKAGRERLVGAGGFGAAGIADRQAAFTLAVIVLGAKMAKADGRVTPDEIRAFREVFHIPPEEVEAVGRLFNEAKREATGFEPYAAQIAQLFGHDRMMLEELLGGLFHIARAGGGVNQAELQYLRQVADIFGFDGRAFERIRAMHAGAVAAGEGGDPYAVLGLKRNADDDEVKSTYRKLIRENHPDTLIAKGMPQEFIDLATHKMAAINAAYDRVAKERGLK